LPIFEWHRHIKCMWKCLCFLFYCKNWVNCLNMIGFEIIIFFIHTRRMVCACKSPLIMCGNNNLGGLGQSWRRPLFSKCRIHSLWLVLHLFLVGHDNNEWILGWKYKYRHLYTNGLQNISSSPNFLSKNWTIGIDS